MAPHDASLYLYGGDRPWDASLWVDSDDRVRGGKSISHIWCESPEEAHFYGHLDVTALGGAGFASHRTIGTQHIDLAGYDGVALAVAAGDGKKYTLALKDDVLPTRDDGRERSSVSWEFDFVCDGGGEVVARWADFKPTYRGRPKPDAWPLDLADIKRLHIMVRSFFGEQQGDFSLLLTSISAVSKPLASAIAAPTKLLADDVPFVVDVEEQRNRRWWHRAFWK